MVEKNVALAQLGEDVVAAGRQAQLAGHEALVLQVRALGQFVKVEQTGEVDRAVCVEDLPVFQLEVLLQPPGNLGVNSGVNFQPHGVAFAPPVELGADRLE